jgi:cytochrome P450
LYLAGARILANYPIGPRTGCALNVTLLSYCDELHMGLNIDPAAVTDPLAVDFDRGTKTHIDFGTGVHRCLGSHLARMELRIALAALHERISDYAIDAERPPVYHNDGGVRTVEPLHLVFTPTGA